MYNVSSKQAEEFIDHQEILDTLDYAHTNKDNRALIESLLEKAASCKGLSHREAALLLECDQPDLTERIFHLAREIKQKLYGNRIVMFAPLYLSNYCVNGCVYCPYHAKNRTIARKKLSQEEIRREVIDTNVWHWKPAKTLYATPSIIFWNLFRPSMVFIIRMVLSGG